MLGVLGPRFGQREEQREDRDQQRDLLVFGFDGVFERFGHGFPLRASRCGAARRRRIMHVRESLNGDPLEEAVGRDGSAAPAPRAGKSRSPLEAHAPWLLALIAAEPDLSLAELTQRVQAELGQKTSTSAMDRFVQRHKLSFKKNSARRRAGPARRRSSA